MPFKCTKCSKVVQVVPQVNDCEKCENQNFVECPVIHYLHPEGNGDVYCNTTRTSRAPGVLANQQEPLRVACTIRRVPQQCTVLSSLITCPLCIEFMDTKRAPKEPVVPKEQRLDATILDLSDEDKAALEELGL